MSLKQLIKYMLVCRKDSDTAGNQQILLLSWQFHLNGIEPVLRLMLRIIEEFQEPRLLLDTLERESHQCGTGLLFTPIDEEAELRTRR